MFDTIILLLDESVQSETALPVAIDHVKRHEAQLVVMSVVVRPETCVRHLLHGGPHPVLEYPFDSRVGRERADALSYLNRIRRQHHLSGNVELVVRVGDPVHQLQLEASARSQPLVVMAIATEPGSLLAAHQERVTRLLHRNMCPLLLIAGYPETPTRFPNELVARKPTPVGSLN